MAGLSLGRTIRLVACLVTLLLYESTVALDTSNAQEKDPPPFDVALADPVKESHSLPKISVLLPKIQYSDIGMFAEDSSSATYILSTLDTLKPRISDVINMAIDELRTINKGSPVLELFYTNYVMPNIKMLGENIQSVTNSVKAAFGSHRVLGASAIIGDVYAINTAGMVMSFSKRNVFVCSPFQYVDPTVFKDSARRIGITNYPDEYTYNSVGKWFNHIGWKSVVIISTGVPLFNKIDPAALLSILKHRFGIKADLEFCEFASMSKDDLKSFIARLKLSGSRAFLLLGPEVNITIFLIEAFKQSMVLPNYAWVTFSFPRVPLALRQLGNNLYWINLLFRNTIILNPVHGHITKSKYERLSPSLVDFVSNKEVSDDSAEYLVGDDGVIYTKNTVQSSSPSDIFPFPYPPYVTSAYSCVYKIAYNIYCTDRPDINPGKFLSESRDNFCNIIKSRSTAKDDARFTPMYAYALSNDGGGNKSSYRTRNVSYDHKQGSIGKYSNTHSNMRNVIDEVIHGVTKPFTSYTTYSPTGVTPSGTKYDDSLVIQFNNPNYIHTNYLIDEVYPINLSPLDINYTAFNVIDEYGEVFNATNSGHSSSEDNWIVNKLRAVETTAANPEVYFLLFSKVVAIVIISLQVITAMLILWRFFAKETELHLLKSVMAIVGLTIESVFCYVYTVFTQIRSFIIIAILPPIAVFLIFAGIITRPNYQTQLSLSSIPPMLTKRYLLASLKPLRLPALGLAAVLLIRIALTDYSSQDYGILNHMYQCTKSVDSQVTCAIAISSLEGLYVITFIFAGALCSLNKTVIYKETGQRLKIMVLVYKHIIFYLTYYTLVVARLMDNQIYVMIPPFLLFVSAISSLLLYIWPYLFKPVIGGVIIPKRDKFEKKHPKDKNVSLYVESRLQEMGMITVESFPKHLQSTNDSVTVLKCYCKFYKSIYHSIRHECRYLLQYNGEDNTCSFRRTHNFQVVGGNGEHLGKVEAVPSVGKVVFLSRSKVSEHLDLEGKLYELDIFIIPFDRIYASVRFVTLEDYRNFVNALYTNARFFTGN